MNVKARQEDIGEIQSQQPLDLCNISELDGNPIAYYYIVILVKRKKETK